MSLFACCATLCYSWGNRQTEQNWRGLLVLCSTSTENLSNRLSSLRDYMILFFLREIVICDGYMEKLQIALRSSWDRTLIIRGSSLLTWNGVNPTRGPILTPFCVRQLPSPFYRASVAVWRRKVCYACPLLCVKLHHSSYMVGISLLLSPLCLYHLFFTWSNPTTWRHGVKCSFHWRHCNLYMVVLFSSA